ncbi:uncharacterized protein TNCV_2110171 [Trichonephila clavipes]|nr:uncharacterized protein TNCV_2110171 [Trichonephila clavipes]
MMDKHNRTYPTRGLLATDHVILNHGQVTWTTPELAPSSPNYHTIPTGLDRFKVHRCPTGQVFSGTGLELMTCLPCSDTLTTGRPQPRRCEGSPPQKSHYSVIYRHQSKSSPSV